MGLCWVCEDGGLCTGYWVGAFAGIRVMEVGSWIRMGRMGIGIRLLVFGNMFGVYTQYHEFQICESFVTDRGLFTDSDIVNFAYAHA